MSSNTQDYTTRLLVEAATLTAAGFPADVVAINRSTVVFAFPVTSDVLAAVAQFNEGRAHVEPRAFAAATRKLRQQMDEALIGFRRGSEATYA